MPIIRKVTTVGEAKGITLPKSWLDWVERQTGKPVREVLLEIDKTITIIPILEEQKE
jgi:hypothetical protein